MSTTLAAAAMLMGLAGGPHCVAMAYGIESANGGHRIARFLDQLLASQNVTGQI